MQKARDRDGAKTMAAASGRRNRGGSGVRLSVTVAAAAALTASLSACEDDPVGPGEPGEAPVSLLFEAAADVGASDATAADTGLSTTRTIEGTNGTLVLETMHVTVEEVELDRADDGEDFELGPFFTGIPLAEGAAVEVFHESIPAGRYDEFELEIEEPDDELLEEIRGEYPYWPEDASLRITGTFEPEDGEPQEFLVFMEAEIEVELDFEPHLVVSEDEPGRTVTITVNPSLWFMHGDGSVVDLTEYHCDPPEVCPIPELEVEIEREGGSVFTEIEWG